MSDYLDWLASKRGGRGFNQPRLREEKIEVGEKRPFNRRWIIDNELRKAEQDLAYTTRWLADPLATHNHEHFLDWRFDANDRYARALALHARLPVQATVSTVSTQMRLL